MRQRKTLSERTAKAPRRPDEAMQLTLGLLINFNVSLLKNRIKRIGLGETHGDLGVLAIGSHGGANEAEK
jgi:hypothetical protein